MKNTFWRDKSLFDMNQEEWESICDGCAKCCLLQLEDDASKQLVFTEVACRLLDQETCRCVDYPNRSKRVPACMALTKENVEACAAFAPPSCSYRLLLEGKQLPEWHHLCSGSRKTIHRASASVRGKVRSEEHIGTLPLENFVVQWPEQV